MQSFNFDKLDKTYHMFKWLNNDPYKLILNTVAKMLHQYAPDAKLVSFHVTGDPEWITGFLDKSDQKKLTRAGCAFEYGLEIKVNGTLRTLTGTCTWVANDLHNRLNMTQKIWLDFEKSLEDIQSMGELEARMNLNAFA